MMCAMTWMNLEDSMLSQVSQTQKEDYSITAFTCSVRKSQIHRDGRWSLGGEGLGGDCLMARIFSFGRRKCSRSD